MKNKIIDLFFEKENNTLKQNNIGWIIYLIIIVILAILIFPVFNTFSTKPKLLNSKGVLSLEIECENKKENNNKIYVGDKIYCILTFAPLESNLELKTVDFKISKKGIENIEVYTVITYDTPVSTWYPNNKGIYSASLYPDIRLFEEVHLNGTISKDIINNKASIELKNIKITDTDDNYYKIESVKKEIIIR